MLIRPDPDEAGAERDGVRRALSRGLTRAAGSPDGLELGYPGTFAHLFGKCGSAPEALLALAERARASADRSKRLGCPAWQVDPAPPDLHLTGSLDRAISQLPADRARPDLRVVAWSADELQVLCTAGCLLERVFPEVLAELRVLVRQVALLGGKGIAGYTDFGVHGAIFLNRGRLTDDPAGLPAHVRLAEAVVHEGAHVRCNAAGWARPYLADPKDRSVLIDTPLRPDRRPVNGLFQQFVVLVRSIELYDRVLAGDELTGMARTAASERRAKLSEQAAEAVAALRSHQTLLSERGLADLEEADRVLSGSRPASFARS
ncbi:MAG TPA: HEXXH motif-containing putative peptide modification protein [Pseudonocardia sp.]|nr:HEXXH motif-containing putative peptide modification protein [Pseudonocardia sp.]